MTGSWLIVKWAVAGAAGLCVGTLLIVWIMKGVDFVYSRPAQKIFFAFVIAIFLSDLSRSLGSAVARFCFVLAGFVYAGIAVVLLRDLAENLRVLVKRILVRADS